MSSKGYRANGSSTLSHASRQVPGVDLIDEGTRRMAFRPVCGSPATLRKAFENYWNEMRFGNLLVLCQFGTLPANLTRKNLELFAREVMPALKSLRTD